MAKMGHKKETLEIQKHLSFANTKIKIFYTYTVAGLSNIVHV